MLVLVTGAAGRIGAHVTRALGRQGHNVRALVLPADPRSDAVSAPYVEFIEGRLEDRDACARAVAKVDAIYHLGGALTSRGNTDEEFFEVNLRGTFNLLMAARDHASGLRLFAYASSGAVYIHGAADYLPVDENHPRRASTVYAASKIGAEELCLAFWRGFGLPTTIFRFGAVADAVEMIDPHGTFGPELYLRAAIRALDPTTSAGVVRLVPAGPKPSTEQLEALATLRALDTGTDQLLVHTDLNGKPFIRQIADARDVADGILRALEVPAAIGEAFDIAGPEPFDSEQFTMYVARRLSLPVVTARLPIRRPAWYFSSAKARMILGYEPSRTVFDMVDDALVARGEVVH